MIVSRFLCLFVTRSMGLWALLVIAHPSASAQATTCGSWASVTGWKGEYRLTGSGSLDYGGGASATVNYSSSATMHLKRPGPQPCPSSALYWGEQIEASNATGSASYQLTVPCGSEPGNSVESWSASQVGPTSSADLLVNPTQGSIVFYPLLDSGPLTLSVVRCGSSSSTTLPMVSFTPVGQSEIPPINLPAQPLKTVSATSIQFSAVDGQSGITVNWTLSFTFTPDCDVPDGELTTWSGWYTTLGEWEQTLESAGKEISYAGLTVTEVDAGGGMDTCHFKGSAYNPFDKVTGSSWQVDDSNNWGTDDIGWGALLVAYYRLKDSAPCGFTLHQQMQIACWDGSKNNYGPVNTLQGLIGTSTITSERAGHSRTRSTQ